MFSSSWTDIYNPVTLFDCLFIMFNNQHSVAQIAQANKCVDKATVISLMQTNAWLIKNIESADQP